MDLFTRKLHDIQNNRKKRGLWQRIVTGLAGVTVFVTVYSLILPAITQEKQVFCGFEEHEHSEENGCYSEVKIITCGFDEDPPEPHKHSDGCYADQRSLLCTLEESEGHSHTDECRDENGELVCGLDDSLGHTHREECYVTERVLTCELSEDAPPAHVHTEACWEISPQLTCELEEHKHTLACRSDPEADVETAAVWKRTFDKVELTGEWTKDVLAIAETQLGYKESRKNYTVINEKDKKGYSRYGDWYGDPYGDWCAMFVSFCLNYAGVDKGVIPYESNCANWIAKLTELELYRRSYNDMSQAQRDELLAEMREELAAERAAQAEKAETAEAANTAPLSLAKKQTFSITGAEAPVDEDEGLAIPALTVEEELPVLPRYTPKPGDIVFFDRDNDGRSDHVGLVCDVLDVNDASVSSSAANAEAALEEALGGEDWAAIDSAARELEEALSMVPAKIRTIEGNSADQVRHVTYDLDDHILVGYAELPEDTEAAGINAASLMALARAPMLKDSNVERVGTFVKKVDSETSEGLPDAKFLLSKQDGTRTLYYSNGAWVTEQNDATLFISDAEGLVTLPQDLSEGTYTLTETAMPVGYTAATLTTTLRISEKGMALTGEDPGPWPVTPNSKYIVNRFSDIYGIRDGYLYLYKPDGTPYPAGTEVIYTPVQVGFVGNSVSSTVVGWSSRTHLGDGGLFPITTRSNFHLASGEPFVVVHKRPGYDAVSCAATYQDHTLYSYSYATLWDGMAILSNKPQHIRWDVEYTSSADTSGIEYIKNQSLYTNHGIIYLEDSETGERLADGDFVLSKTSGGQKLYYSPGTATNWSSNIGDAEVFTTDSNGSTVLPSMTEGSYAVEQIKAPDSYSFPSALYTFTIAPDGTPSFAEPWPLSGAAVSAGSIDYPCPSQFVVQNFSGLEVEVPYDWSGDVIGLDGQSEASVGVYLLKPDGTPYPAGTSVSYWPKELWFSGNSIVATISGSTSYTTVLRDDGFTYLPVRASFQLVSGEPFVVYYKRDGFTATGMTVTNRTGTPYTYSDDMYIFWRDGLILAPKGISGLFWHPTFTESTATGAPNILTVKNTRGVTEASLTIKKTAKDGGAPLADAVFDLVLNSRTIGSYTTGSNGTVTVSGLREGVYTLMEATAPPGYMRSPLSWDVSVTSGDIAVSGANSDSWSFDEATNTFTLEDEVTTVTIMKVDSDTGNAISSPAKFTLKNESGDWLTYSGGSPAWTASGTEFSTSSDGTLTFPSLPVGSYTLVEEAPPEGYDIVYTGEYELIISDDGSVQVGHTEIIPAAPGATVSKKVVDRNDTSSYSGAVGTSVMTDSAANMKDPYQDQMNWDDDDLKMYSRWTDIDAGEIMLEFEVNNYGDPAYFWAYLSDYLDVDESRIEAYYSSGSDYNPSTRVKLPGAKWGYTYDDGLIVALYKTNGAPTGTYSVRIYVPAKVKDFTTGWETVSNNAGAIYGFSSNLTGDPVTDALASSNTQWRMASTSFARLSKTIQVPAEDTKIFNSVDTSVLNGKPVFLINNDSIAPPTGTLNIKKLAHTDVGAVFSGAPLPGAVFRLTPVEPAGTAIDSSPTNASGEVSIPDLSPGIYELTELTSPVDYKRSAAVWTVTVDSSTGGVTAALKAGTSTGDDWEFASDVFTLTNKLDTVSLTIRKTVVGGDTAEQAGTAASALELMTLPRSDADVASQVPAGATITIVGQYGDYYMATYGSSRGYALKSLVTTSFEDFFTFEVTVADKNGGDAALSSIPGAVTAGNKATFSLANGGEISLPELPRDAVVTVSESDHDGYTVLYKEGNVNLTAGDTLARFTLSAELGDRTVDVVNNPGILLPSTGGYGALPYYALGGTLMLSAVLMFGLELRRSRKGGNK